MVIANNLLSQFTARQLNINSGKKEKAAEKLSSGYRINRASDNAAGLKISEKMRMQIRGLMRGAQNTQEGISWIQTADGAMEEVMEMVQRIRELAVQASNDTNSMAEREAINSEIKQLKSEINRVGIDTEFNKQQVFSNDVEMKVEGNIGDLQIFNSKYDAKTGNVEYGGFIFAGNRVGWDTFPGMVSVDASGRQVFSGGTYEYVEPNSGAHFELICNAGDEVPRITRKLSVSADASGIMIDKVKHGWDELHKTDDYIWELEHEGVKLSFFVPNEQMGMAEAINEAGKRYSWNITYAGSEDVQAVDANVVQNIRLSNYTVNQMAGNHLSYTVRADQDGIWLETTPDPSIPGAVGSMVNGSKKTWAEMNIQSWDSGPYISSTLTYTFADTEGSNDTYIAFDFTLDDVTSCDSVIDGLDGMVISGDNIKNTYAVTQDVTLDNNILSASVLGGDKVHFSEEKELGRDFDQQIVQGVAKDNVSYDKATGEITLAFSDSAGNPVIEYKGNSKQAEDYLRLDLSSFLSNIMQQKQNLLLSGGNPDDAVLKPTSIRDVLGYDKITADGYLSETVTLTDQMILTDGVDTPGFQPGEPGKTYPAAVVDFSAIGTRDLAELAGTGFNSDCKTCDNYYSIRFEDFSVSGIEATNETADGYKYNIRETKRVNSDRSNYTLQIDINSLKAQGITTGAQLSEALVKIAQESLDMHFTQYAADGSKFYIYDNRESGSGAPSAMFDTVPMPRPNVDELGFVLSTDDGRKMELLYKYDFSDAKDWVHVQMTNDNNGDYVADGVTADGNTKYRKYNSATDAGKDRYKLETSFEDKGNAGSPLGSLKDVVNQYTQFALGKMLGNTGVELNALDYTYIGVKGDENQNVAVKSVFDSVLTDEKEQEGLQIQHSGTVWDSTKIPKFGLNTFDLNLYKAGTLTYEQAQETIQMSDDAIRILSGKRSAYGALQNRFEHVYANSCNMSENTQAAESRLRDADMAEEVVAHSRYAILQSVMQAMLAQTNQSPQGVLSLLGGQ